MRPQIPQDNENRIDEQWKDSAPHDWGNNKHKGEHRMLYDLIEADEDLKCIIGGLFGPDLGQANATKSLHRGIAVATTRRIIMVDKGVFGSTEVAEMAYDSVEAITHSTGMFAAGLHISGRGTMHFRIESIQPKEDAKRFADCVRSSLPTPALKATAVPVGVTSPPVLSSISAADEIEKLATLMSRGILTQEEFDSKKKQLLGL